MSLLVTALQPADAAQPNPFTQAQNNRLLEKQMRKETILVPGAATEFWLYTPHNILPKSSPIPLVVAFHGYRMTALDMARMTQFNALADQEGFLVAYPDAGSHEWQGKGVPDDNTNDLVFTEAMLKRITEIEPVDTGRIYATGFSNGGFFTERLACEMSGRFAGFATVAATMGRPLIASCLPKSPVNMLVMNGRQDPIVTWEGGIRWVNPTGRVKIVSVTDTLRFWQAQSGLPASDREAITPGEEPSDPRLKDSSKKWRHYPFADRRRPMVSQQYRIPVPSSDSQLTQWIIWGGGHTWPGAEEQTFINRLFLGRTAQDISASQVIWDFFKAL